MRGRLGLLLGLLAAAGLVLAGCDICWPRGGRLGVCDNDILIPDDDSADDDAVDDDDSGDDDDVVDDDDSSGDDDDSGDDDSSDDDDATPDPCDQDWATPLLSSFGYTFSCLSPVSYVMGSDVTEEDREEDEVQHAVQLTGSMLVGTTEVHQELFEDVAGRAPSDCDVGCDPAYPVQMVSWDDAIAFCNQVSLLEELEPVYTFPGGGTAWDTGADGYRLLTESEWEYAARGGVSGGPYAGGSSHLAEVAVCFDTGTQPGGSRAPNPFGLSDMSGNVSEWVWDWYDAYPPSDVGDPAIDPAGPAVGALRVHRGGSWRGPAAACRVADRDAEEPESTDNSRGFRIARTVP